MLRILLIFSISILLSGLCNLQVHISHLGGSRSDGVVEFACNYDAFSLVCNVQTTS